MFERCPVWACAQPLPSTVWFLLVACLVTPTGGTAHGQATIWNPPHAQNAASTMLNTRLDFDKLRSSMYSVFGGASGSSGQDFLRKALAMVRSNIAASINADLEVTFAVRGEYLVITFPGSVSTSIKIADVEVSDIFENVHRAIVDSVIPELMNNHLQGALPPLDNTKYREVLDAALQTIVYQYTTSGDDQSIVQRWAGIVWQRVKPVILDELKAAGIVQEGFVGDQTALNVTLNAGDVGSLFTNPLSITVELDKAAIAEVRNGIIAAFPGITEDILEVTATAHSGLPFAFGLPMLDAALAEQKAEGTGSIGMTLVSIPCLRIDAGMQIQSTLDVGDPLSTNGRFLTAVRLRFFEGFEFEVHPSFILEETARLFDSAVWRFDGGVGAFIRAGDVAVIGVTGYWLESRDTWSAALSVKAASQGSPVVVLGLSRRGGEKIQPLVQVLYPLPIGEAIP